MSSDRVVAVACAGSDGLAGNVSSQLAETPYFLVARIEGKEIVTQYLIPTPALREGGSTIAQFIRFLGAGALIAGGVGAQVRDALAACGIEVFSDISGKAGEALHSLIGGALGRAESCGAGQASAPPAEPGRAALSAS